TRNGEVDDDAAFIRIRLALVDVDGDLARNAAEIWSVIDEESLRITRSFWKQYSRSPEIVRRIDGAKLEELTDRVIGEMRPRYEAIDSPRWVAFARDNVVSAVRAGISVSTHNAALWGQFAAAHEVLSERLEEDPERLARLSRALTQVALLQSDVFLAQYGLLRQQDLNERRSAVSEAFNSEVLKTVQGTTEDSRTLRAKAAQASRAARGM